MSEGMAIARRIKDWMEDDRRRVVRVKESVERQEDDG